jgi:hypothetical protein
MDRYRRVGRPPSVAVVEFDGVRHDPRRHRGVHRRDLRPVAEDHCLGLPPRSRAYAFQIAATSPRIPGHCLAEEGRERPRAFARTRSGMSSGPSLA